MTVFPVRRAPVAIPFASMKGKLKGDITGQTPRGFAMILPCSPGPPSVSLAVSLVLLHDLRVEIDGVDGLPRLGEGLEPVLSDLVGDRGGDLELALVDQLRGPLEDPDPLPPGGPAPAGEGALRCLYGLPRVLPLPDREVADDDRRVDRAPVLELARLGAAPPSRRCASVVLAELRRGELLQGRLVLRVDALVGEEGDVGDLWSVLARKFPRAVSAS